MTEGMQGRSSDTRMYNPRSESSHMYRNNHEEDTYSPDDAKHRDEKYEEKQKRNLNKMLNNMNRKQKKLDKLSNEIAQRKLHPKYKGL